MAGIPSSHWTCGLKLQPQRSMLQSHSISCKERGATYLYVQIPSTLTLLCNFCHLHTLPFPLFALRKCFAFLLSELYLLWSESFNYGRKVKDQCSRAYVSPLSTLLPVLQQAELASARGDKHALWTPGRFGGHG